MASRPASRPGAARSSVKVLIKQMLDYITHSNTNPKPFVRNATTEEIPAMVRIVQTNIKNSSDNDAK